VIETVLRIANLFKTFLLSIIYSQFVARFSGFRLFRRKCSGLGQSLPKSWSDASNGRSMVFHH